MGYDRILRRLLEYGVLAPSIYNSQPWKFHVFPDQGVVEVHADEKRGRPLELDPTGRDLYLALGACVEQMAIAASALGYELKENLFPADGPEGPVARLQLKPLAETLPESLFSTLLTRQTHAGKYQDGSVKEIHLERLRHLPGFFGKEKIYFTLDGPALSRLVQLLHDLSHEGSSNSALQQEMAGWIRTEEDAQEGFPLGVLGLPISVKARFALLRYFGRQRELREVARQALLRQGHGVEAPAFLLVTTSDPTPAGFLRCGRGMAKLSLTLSELELASQALFLPITLDTASATLLESFGAGQEETPVFLLRFGKPEEKRWPRTFRRPVEETLFNVGPVSS